MPPTHQAHDHILFRRELSSSALAIRIAIPVGLALLCIAGAILFWHRRRIWGARTKNGGRDGVRRVYG